MDEDKNEVNEPGAEYISPKKITNRTITFFKSFEEAETHGLKQMAAHTYEERLANLEILRKRTYSHLLLPNGHWPSIQRTITIVKGIRA